MVAAAPARPGGLVALSGERRVLVTRSGAGDVLLHDASGTGAGPVSVPAARWPSVAAAPERAGTRWVWDDTTRWYPALLADGARVERATDLRLRHAVLRRSPAVDQDLLAGPDTAAWDALEPVTAAGTGAGELSLFDLGAPAAPLDAAVELARQDAALAASPERARLRLLLAAESAGALVAAEMTHAGMPWRADVHDAILTAQLGPRPAPGQRPAALAALLPRVRGALSAPDLNPDSPVELVRALRRAGLDVPDTRSWTLAQLDHPAVPLLLEHRRLARLHAANGWRWLEQWVRDGRYRPAYLPGGVVTGRWAALGGGALSVPAVLRPAVAADPGWCLVVADVAQLEPRVLAAMSGDEALAAAARTSDLYQGVVDDGGAPTRQEAKTAVLGALYGATSGQGGRLVEHLARRYPRAIGCVEAAARAGERGEVVTTWLGRASPLPSGAWTSGAQEGADGAGAHGQRRAWGRFTRNFVVQGTGAEWALSWIALLRSALARLGPGEGPLTRGPHLVHFLHDEVVVHAPAEQAAAVVGAVRESAGAAGRLLFGGFPVDFPLDVVVADSWG